MNLTDAEKILSRAIKDVKWWRDQQANAQISVGINGSYRDGVNFAIKLRESNDTTERIATLAAALESLSQEIIEEALRLAILRRDELREKVLGEAEEIIRKYGNV